MPSILSNAQLTSKYNSLNKRINCVICEKGQPGGYATLDDDGLVPIDQLPAGGGNTYEIVENYSSLPNPTTVPEQIYVVLNSQGTKWLPWSLGGTFYPKGFYYSTGIEWNYLGEFPYEATQAEVDTGIRKDVFVSPFTFDNANKWTTISSDLDGGFANSVYLPIQSFDGGMA